MIFCAKLINRSLLLDIGLFRPSSSPFLLTQAMGKKRKKRKSEKVVKSQEQLDASSSNVIRLHDRVGTPETPVSMAKTIRNQINMVNNGYVTRKHIARFKQYKSVKDVTDLLYNKLSRTPRTFITPLTMLQHNSNLPLNFDMERHNFPHTLHYKVDWYGSALPSPYPADNSCYITFNLNEFSDKQADALKQVLGPSRYDPDTGIAILESNVFNDLNQNASYLGDLCEYLFKKIRKL